MSGKREHAAAGIPAAGIPEPSCWEVAALGPVARREAGRAVDLRAAAVGIPASSRPVVREVAAAQGTSLGVAPFRALQGVACSNTARAPFRALSQPRASVCACSRAVVWRARPLEAALVHRPEAARVQLPWPEAAAGLRAAQWRAPWPGRAARLRTSRVAPHRGCEDSGGPPTQDPSKRPRASSSHAGARSAAHRRPPQAVAATRGF